MRAAERVEPEATNMRDQIIRNAWVSRDTAVDASRMGANMRAYNMITAFANIKLQDTDRVVRAIRDNPLGSLVKIGGAITVPSLLLWAANHDDPRYKELPAWQKNMFWIVMTPTHMFRVPKPWGMGLLFGSLPERLLDAYTQENPGAFGDFFKSLMQTIGPDFVPTAAAPIIDQFANRSTFTNRTLIPSTQEKWLPEYQYTPYTTELAKQLGQIIGSFPGMKELQLGDTPILSPLARGLSSPILIENYVRAWTGGLGIYALNATDAALRKMGILPDPVLPAKRLEDNPFIKSFTIAYPSATAASIQTFHDRNNYNQRFYETWKAQAKMGNVFAMQHIAAMGGDEMFQRLQGFQTALATQQRFVQNVYRMNMDPDQKRQLIDQTYYQMIQTARLGNQIMDMFEQVRRGQRPQ
jgi:hypothetical protein